MTRTSKQTRQPAVYTRTDAELSEDRAYRYTLTREWSLRTPERRVVFVMLNPSTADDRQDDATIRRCVGFGRDWGFDALDVINLFALRSRSPKALLESDDPVGPENVAAQERVLSAASLVVAAWGVNIPRAFRSSTDACGQVLRLRHSAHVLCLTSQGYPMHPLFVPRATVPIRWEVP